MVNHKALGKAFKYSKCALVFFAIADLCYKCNASSADPQASQSVTAPEGPLVSPNASENLIENNNSKETEANTSSQEESVKKMEYAEVKKVVLKCMKDMENIKPIDIDSEEYWKKVYECCGVIGNLYLPHLIDKTQEEPTNTLSAEQIEKVKKAVEEAFTNLKEGYKHCSGSIKENKQATDMFKKSIASIKKEWEILFGAIKPVEQSKGYLERIFGGNKKDASASNNKELEKNFNEFKKELESLLDSKKGLIDNAVAKIEAQITACKWEELSKEKEQEIEKEISNLAKMSHYLDFIETLRNIYFDLDMIISGQHGNGKIDAISYVKTNSSKNIDDKLNSLPLAETEEGKKAVEEAKTLYQTFVSDAFPNILAFGAHNVYSSTNSMADDVKIDDILKLGYIIGKNREEEFWEQNKVTISKKIENDIDKGINELYERHRKVIAMIVKLAKESSPLTDEDKASIEELIKDLEEKGVKVSLKDGANVDDGALKDWVSKVLNISIKEESKGSIMQSIVGSITYYIPTQMPSWFSGGSKKANDGTSLPWSHYLLKTIEDTEDRLKVESLVKALEAMNKVLAYSTVQVLKSIEKKDQNFTDNYLNAYYLNFSKGTIAIIINNIIDSTLKKGKVSSLLPIRASKEGIVDARESMEKFATLQQESISTEKFYTSPASVKLVTKDIIATLENIKPCMEELKAIEVIEDNEAFKKYIDAEKAMEGTNEKEMLGVVSVEHFNNLKKNLIETVNTELSMETVENMHYTPAIVSERLMRIKDGVSSIQYFIKGDSKVEEQYKVFVKSLEKTEKEMDEHMEQNNKDLPLFLDLFVQKGQNPIIDMSTVFATRTNEEIHQYLSSKNKSMENVDNTTNDDDKEETKGFFTPFNIFVGGTVIVILLGVGIVILSKKKRVE
ncbi:hypothetical protein NECID01_0907 [Nematocida sp. AWRm77]|nr:hypothetical protein NECID01_0907 [Nematocida sp. AWRm77]